MTSLRTKALAALAACAALPITAAAGAAGAAPASVLPDDLAFLNSPAIDDLIADAENGSADCAALEAVMGIAFISAFASSDMDFGLPSDSDAPASTEPTISVESFWGVSAPFLAPLLDRASTDDPSAAAFVEIVGPQLVGAVYELRDLGFTDDELLLIQESFAAETRLDDESEETVPDDSALAELEARAEQLLTYEFESITFLDEDAVEGMPGEDSDSFPWEAGCPETASLLDFDMDPVSATIDFEVVITAP